MRVSSFSLGGKLSLIPLQLTQSSPHLNNIGNLSSVNSSSLIASWITVTQYQVTIATMSTRLIVSPPKNLLSLSWPSRVFRRSIASSLACSCSLPLLVQAFHITGKHYSSQKKFLVPFKWICIRVMGVLELNIMTQFELWASPLPVVDFLFHSSFSDISKFYYKKMTSD